MCMHTLLLTRQSILFRCEMHDSLQIRSNSNGTMRCIEVVKVLNRMKHSEMFGAPVMSSVLMFFLRHAHQSKITGSTWVFPDEGVRKALK